MNRESIDSPQPNGEETRGNISPTGVAQNTNDSQWDTGEDTIIQVEQSVRDVPEKPDESQTSSSGYQSYEAHAAKYTPPGEWDFQREQSPMEMQSLQQPEKRKRSSDLSLSRHNKVHNKDAMASNKEAPMSRSDEGIGCCGYVLMGFSLILIVLFFPLSLCLCIKVVQEYERAVIFRLGRVMSGGAKGPGMFFLFPCVDDMRKVDLRTVAHDIPPQEILTKDSVTVAVDAVIYMRIFDANMSVCNVENAFHSTQLLAATTLRNILGTKNMSELLTEREAMAESMQQHLDDATDPWGIKVERVEIKDVRLPLQLQRAMAAEAEASREARAKVVAAEGEQKASRALKEAADIIAQSPSALQLRYLQTLNSIAAEKNSTIIFPLPIDMLQGMLKK